MTVTASDPDAGTTFTYSINGGADAAKFAIDSTTGALSFVRPRAKQNPTDVGADNVYNVIVQASDGSLSATKAVAVTVTNVNDNAPVITSSATASVAENTTAVMTVTASDADGASPFTYSINGGADAAKFAVNASTGALSFLSAPDYENPTDVGADNVYNVCAVAPTAHSRAPFAVAVTVTDVNDQHRSSRAPLLPRLPRNTTSVMTVAASDPDAELRHLHI